MKNLLTMCILATLLGVVSSPAAANERHFTYTYETAVLPPDGREIELWTTARVGRDTYYSRFDERLEFEVGLTDRLQTAFYLNFAAVSAETMPGVVESEFGFEGVASEFKLQLTDPVADALGFGLYAEVGAAPGEAYFEAKLLFDKRIGNVLLAANLVGEHEMSLGPGSESELELEFDLGLAFFVSTNVSIGLEARSKTALPGYEELEYSALWLGPTFSYSSKGWWLALSVLPQLPALAKEGDGGGPDLDHNESVSARLLFSFEL